MSEKRTALGVRCQACGHRWIGLYAPMPAADAARVMGNLTCPMCAAGADKICPATPPPAFNTERASAMFRLFLQGKALADIGAMYGITGGRVHQIIARFTRRELRFFAAELPTSLTSGLHIPRFTENSGFKAFAKEWLVILDHFDRRSSGNG